MIEHLWLTKAIIIILGIVAGYFFYKFVEVDSCYYEYNSRTKTPNLWKEDGEYTSKTHR